MQDNLIVTYPVLIERFFARTLHVTALNFKNRTYKYIQATFAAVIGAAGMRLGEITNFGTAEAPCLYVYVRDPEGNATELEQH